MFRNAFPATPILFEALGAGLALQPTTIEPSTSELPAGTSPRELFLGTPTVEGNAS